MTVLDRAREMALTMFGSAPRDALAHPFGLAQHDAHRWRMSPDVWESLWAEVEPWMFGSAQLRSTDRMLGMPMTRDASLPPNALVLEADTHPDTHREQSSTTSDHLGPPFRE